LGCRPGLFRIVIDILAKHTGDRRLLDHLAIIAAVQIVQDATDDPGVLDATAVAAARSSPEPGVGYIRQGRLRSDNLQRALVLQILLGLAARHL
jgi:hypothetical protein